MRGQCCAGEECIAAEGRLALQYKIDGKRADMEAKAAMTGLGGL